MVIATFAEKCLSAMGNAFNTQIPQQPDYQPFPFISIPTPMPQHHKVWLSTPENEEKIRQGLSAYLDLSDAFLSIAARVYLIRNAEQNIDLQYYIWKDDVIGHLILAELLKAADRGVKIRLLLDDQNETKLDSTLQTLNAHPNFEIRLFNPYTFRRFRVYDYLLSPLKSNHRMHNKLIVTDQRAAVTGGRNISNEYFDAGNDFQFNDLDVLFYGASVAQANQVFQDFWQHAFSVELERLIGSAAATNLDVLRQKYHDLEHYSTKTKERITATDAILKRSLQLNKVTWAKATFVADSPKKITDSAVKQELIHHQLQHLMGSPKRHMRLVSAYFVPTQQGEQYFSTLAQSKVKIQVLTNSFVATDVSVVHSFYSNYRKNLLKNGVQLYEFKPYVKRTKRTWYEKITGNIIPAKGKSNSSLHAKFFDLDGKVFIGSFNFDPRSAHLNTEVGLVIESEKLAKQISNLFERYLILFSYELKLNQDGEIIWLEHKRDGSIVEYSHDPETTKFQRFMMRLVSRLPFEKLM